MSRSRLIVLLTLAATLAFAPRLVAQRSDRAIITGLVSDPTGAAVPEAKVIVTDEATRVQTVVGTTGTGNYTTPLLILGTYTVRIEKQGFKGFERPGIQLSGGMIFRQDATLELGAVTQTIEVKATSEMINVASAEVSTSVNQKYYQDLPVVMGADMRLAEALLYVQPGFAPMRPNGDATFRGSGYNSRINGGQTMAVENWMDGAGFGYAMGHEETQESSPPYEAIREMNVITSSFSAQYGRTAGAFVEYVSKSGTNNWHGSVYEYLVNDKLNACGFWCAWKMPVRNNDYGFTVGGPIRKEKTFFFTNLALMNLRQETSLGYPNTVPIPEFRQGNFSQLLGKSLLQIGTDALARPVFQGEIFDPSSTQLVNGVPVRDGYGFDSVTGLPIAGQANIIPSNCPSTDPTQCDPLLSSIAAKITALMPPPDRPGLQYNVHGGTSMPNKKLDVKTWLLRVDHTFNPNLKMSTTFWMNERPRIVGCGGVQACDAKYPPAQSEKNTDYIGPGYYQRIGNRFAHLQFDWIIKPYVFNHTTISFDRWYMGGWGLSAGVGWLSRLGIKGLPPEYDALANMPSIGFSGLIPYSGLGSGGWSKGFQTGNRYQLLDDLTWITGKHALRLGFEWRHHQFNEVGWGRNISGGWSFNRQETAGYDAQGNNLTATGDPFASFLLGQVDNASFAAFQPTTWRDAYTAFFVNDEIKVTPKLTLNLGLRWDYQFPKSESHDRFSSIDITAPNPGAGGIPGAMVFAGTGTGRTGSHTFEKPTKDAWGPRFGFAYRLTNKDVIRGGYGMYYAGVSYNFSQGDPDWGLGATYPAASNLTNGLQPAFWWDDGFPAQYTRPPVLDPAIANGGTPRGVLSNDTNLPRYQNWSLTYQRQVSDNLALEISYVANKGTRLPIHPNALGYPLNNMNDPAILALGASALQAPIVSAQAQALAPIKGMPTFTIGGVQVHLPYASFKGNVAQALRPYPQYQRLYWRGGFPGGNSIYHSLQTKLEKRFSNGLQLRVAYTWSKLINNGAENALIWDAPMQNPVNQAAERSLSTDDVPHTLIVAYTYALPFGKGMRWANVGGVANQVVGGWHVAGIQRYNSGRPAVITMNNNLYGFLFNNVKRPNKVGNFMWAGGHFDPAKDLYYSKSGWADPDCNDAACTTRTLRFGNAARTDPTLRDFPVPNEDFNIFKDFPIRREQIKLRFETQFGNIFNRTFFCPANSNWSAGAFGIVSSQCNVPRRIQFGLRLDW
jgi:hypothetical protein